MRNSFLIYAEYEQYFDLLKPEEQAKLIKALFAVFNGKDTEELESEMDGATKMAFAFMRTQLDADTKKYQEKCAKLSENGAKGGAPKGNKNAKNEEKDEENAQNTPKKNEENKQMLDVEEESASKQANACKNNQNKQKVIETTKNNQKQQDKVLVLVKDLVLEEVISLVKNKKINLLDYIINARAREIKNISFKFIDYPVSADLQDSYVLVCDVVDLLQRGLAVLDDEKFAYKGNVFDLVALREYIDNIRAEDVIGIACQLAYGQTDIENSRAYIVGAVFNRYEQSQYTPPTAEERMEQMQKLRKQLDEKFGSKSE